jgi:hypothetical protein
MPIQHFLRRSLQFIKLICGLFMKRISVKDKNILDNQAQCTFVCTISTFDETYQTVMIYTLKSIYVFM